ncbi:MAG: hypothetical protein CSA01_00345 [Bacteroidetes bacterium]|nr:MAG: hypothetical protein CSA01_00345 [Bacteroidota bacterium]
MKKILLWIIKLPNIPDTDYKATLNFKRYQTTDNITKIPFTRNDANEFVAHLPVQPAAGKMEYSISGSIDGQIFHIPEQGEDSIVLRYKDPVPNGFLIPHVLFMILTILFGLRAGLSALFEPKAMKKQTLIAFASMSIGGMILGPIVQKYAFGDYWTGFPFGGDFTDNKMLIMWFVWLIAVIVIRYYKRLSRTVVTLAAIVMTIVYLIPHSMGGSTLDYDKIDQGIHPSEAVKTGINK